MLMFRKYGLPPIAFQLRLRLGAARNLLLASDLSCKEIAARVGFADTYTFSKAFKRALGLSPRAFVRAARRRGPAKTAGGGKVPAAGAKE